jgi:glycosyltransferase involved in cell wall biosynthesis
LERSYSLEDNDCSKSKETVLKIAVITPYFKEPTEILLRCHQSVLSQTISADHFMIADGFPDGELDRMSLQHVKLPRSHADNGNTPRGVGGMLAKNEGYDFVTYLDADNWYHASHLESMLTVHFETKSEVVTSFREFYDHNNELLDISEHAEDCLLHVDTSCIFLSKSAFSLLPIWMQMPRELGPACDRVFLAAMKHHRFRFASTQKRTVAFSTQYAYHYQLAGRTPPDGSKPADCLLAVFDYLKSVAGVDACSRSLGFWPLSLMEA